MDKVIGYALALAADIHKDDLYGDGPYLFHLLQVLKTVQEQGETIEVQVAAILHDAIEDHPEAEGRIVQFLTEYKLVGVHDTLKRLTRHYFGKETYNEFLDRAIEERDSTVVKLADLQRNAAPKPNRTEHHIRLALERYIPAMAKVTKALLKHERENDAEWLERRSNG
jgi:(p)ppGpp synthase/HD superfamily hydrolase